VGGTLFIRGGKEGLQRGEEILGGILLYSEDFFPSLKEKKLPVWWGKGSREGAGEKGEG